jgi:hypothetical protein
VNFVTAKLMLSRPWSQKLILFRNDLRILMAVMFYSELLKNIHSLYVTVRGELLVSIW